MSALDRFLPLASGEADYDDGDWAEQAHEHLAGQCPWYAKVAGGGSPGGEECKLTALALTPHTAEASTVPQPTVPPGGPGLFHIKGRELPPYIQHLYKHLVGRYGKHGAYRVAVGVVKKWAAGVHPGGKGKHKGGGHVHADVQAAAAKNIAQWEKDEADAHRLHGKDGRHSGHKVAATSPAAEPLELARPYARVERGKLERVSGYNRHGTVAFDFDGVLGSSRHYGWPLPVKPDFSGITKAHKRGYNAAVVTANDPPLVARELRRQGFTTALDPSGQILFWQGGPDGKTVLVTTRKVSAKAYIDDRAVNHMWGDDWEHTLDNVDRVREGYHPVEQPGDHHHFTELSAPPDNVVRVYLAAPASWPSGKPYRESLLPPGPTTGGGLLQGSPLRPGVVSNAPGTKPVGLRQAPSAAVSAGPPLPPGVTLPDPAEFEKLAAKVPDGADATLAESARKHLHMAAVKLRKEDHTEALRALRSAQTGLHAAYRAAYNENLPNTTQVYGAITKVPPAERSSATTEMLAGREVTEHYRTLHHEVAKHIDTFRRAHFHGQYQHMPEARFSGESEAALAGGVIGLLDRFALKHPVEKDGARAVEAKPARKLPSPDRAPVNTGELPSKFTRRAGSGRVRPYFREEHGREVPVHGYDRLAENIEGTARQMTATRAAQHLLRASEYLRAGDHDAAINHLVSAHTISGHHPDVMEHLRAVRAASTQGPLARVASSEQPRQGRRAGHEQRDFHAGQWQGALERMLRQAGPNPHGAAGAVFK